MKNVLIVEDNTELAKYICDIFEIKGYGVRVAYDGVQGWDEIQLRTPDIVVSDVAMPRMDGYELLQRIRQYNLTETLPCILLTARAERENIRRGMTSGADDYLTKPFSPREIIESVEAVLQKQDRFTEKQETTMRLLRKNISYALPHELRTPLQGIIGYANLMQMSYDTLSSEQIQSMSGSIIKAGTRLQRLVENVLAYAQIEILASDPEQQELLRNDLLSRPADIMEQCAIKVAERYQRIRDLKLDLDEKVLRISAENFARVIDELVDNAFKFSKSGTPVTIHSYASDDCYTVLIEDYGRGMSAEQLSNIGAYMQFDRVFYEQQGLGMGLTIAKRLVELHKGTFAIDSMPKEGTAIQLTFVD